MIRKNSNSLLGKLMGIGFVCYFLCIILSTPVFNFLVKHYGICGEAILINESKRIRYHKATLLYNFYYHGVNYKSDSLEEDLTRVGDTIRVVYLKFLPSVNRPITYFEEKEIFSCK
ncbi:hypothetical protein AHMF7605_03235 [Adhaeribacter arboris]|uniref:DUF3592 domain-containing protein n=1 Tax=Adhaeribacter arboris TaxID=2072846 RepID=A0A2T2YAR7_9BACT|nr:hypothetical protein AHMF7605_03235 [Adhaeribacter arboris]